VGLVERFREVERQLPDDWETAQLRVTVPDDSDCARAAALLGPLNPGRRGKVINFVMTRHGGIAGEDRVRSLLHRVQKERIRGDLELVGATAATAESPIARQSTAAQWDEAVASLPSDWSDAFVEIELPSTDYVEPGALQLSPMNPLRSGARPIFRFRVARQFGYGGSPEMARRCFERLDETGMTGTLRILNVLSDTKPVKTQGPVIYSGGRPT
jgi:hypothetical protein